jgi:hypothetical protein
LKNDLICFHTEEATGSIPVSPTIPSNLLVFLVPRPQFCPLAQTRRFLDRIWNVGYTFHQSA